MQRPSHPFVSSRYVLEKRVAWFDARSTKYLFRLLDATVVDLRDLLDLSFSLFASIKASMSNPVWRRQVPFAKKIGTIEYTVNNGHLFALNLRILLLVNATLFI